MSDDSSQPAAELLAQRDRLQRFRALAMTPAERLTRMRLLIEASWATLAQNKDSLDHFRRRNFRARAIRRPAGSDADGP